MPRCPRSPHTPRSSGSTVAALPKVWPAALVWLLLAGACASPPPAPDALVEPLPSRALAPLPEALPPAAIPEPELDPGHASRPDPLLATIEAVLGDRASFLPRAARAEIAAELARAERDDALPALLLLALIEQESRFDASAVGPRGALGLMQIRPFVAADVAHRHGLPFHRSPDLFDPGLNVAIGTRFLAELQAEFADLELALAAYHIGPTRVRSRAKRGWRPRGPYVRTVMNRYQALRVHTVEPTTAFGG